MKKQADQHRSECSFSVGDLVYLKLQPYGRTSLAPRSHQKLAFHFFGPFCITSRIGTVAYKLELPAHSSIHPVFHVSHLKKVVGASHQVITSLPSDFNIHLAPEQILQTYSVARGGTNIAQVLVKWNNLPLDLATWEDYEALCHEFPPCHCLGGKQCPKREGVSTVDPPRPRMKHPLKAGPRSEGLGSRTRESLETNGPKATACMRIRG